jgi:hypothetical protein
MLLELDPNLTPVALPEHEQGVVAHAAFMQALTDRTVRYSGYGPRGASKQTITQSQFPVDQTIGEGQVFHRNYLSYLDICYRHHLGVVLRPDDIWYVLLTQLAEVVKSKADIYADLFTTTPGQEQTIIVVSESLTTMPMDSLMHTLRKVVPTDVDCFLPVFSTTTERVTRACYTAFADLVSPYYRYEMMLCGIPKLEVQGTAEDWSRLRFAWMDLLALLARKQVDVGYWMRQVLQRLTEIVGDLCEGPVRPEFWRKMFYHERCGSGSDVEVRGWFRDFFWTQPKMAYVTNFPSCVARIEYRQRDIDERFAMHQGLFYSQLRDGWLRPEYGSVVLHLAKQPSVTEEALPEVPPESMVDRLLGGLQGTGAKPLEFRVYDRMGGVVGQLNEEALKRVEFK